MGVHALLRHLGVNRILGRPARSRAGLVAHGRRGYFDPPILSGYRRDAIRSPVTLRGLRGEIASNLRPALGRIPLKRLGPADLDAYYTAKSREGKSPATARRYHVHISAALTGARRGEICVFLRGDRVGSRNIVGRDVARVLPRTGRVDPFQFRAAHRPAR